MDVKDKLFNDSLKLYPKMVGENVNHSIIETLDKDKNKKQTVIIRQDKGRKIITCSCENHARYPNHNSVCKHKVCAINYKTKLIEKKYKGV